MAAMLIKGYASTPALDHYDHIVRPGAFDESIREKGLGGPKGIKLLWQHRNEPIGRITELTTDDRGRLVLEGIVEDGTSWGRDAIGAIKGNEGLSFSIGAYLRDADLINLPGGDVALSITKMELLEVSVVVQPAQIEAIMIEWKDHK